jgi:adenylate cyclase
MALFGIGKSNINHADDAVAAARSIQRNLGQLNAERTARGEEAIHIGIGINTGPAIVGSIGSPERMEFTVIGNTVNVASRVEALNKTLGTSLLLTKETRAAMEQSVELSELPSQSVKGVDQPVAIYTI